MCSGYCAACNSEHLTWNELQIAAFICWPLPTTPVVVTIIHTQPHTYIRVCTLYDKEASIKSEQQLPHKLADVEFCKFPSKPLPTAAVVVVATSQTRCFMCCTKCRFLLFQNVVEIGFMFFRGIPACLRHRCARFRPFKY